MSDQSSPAYDLAALGDEPPAEGVGWQPRPWWAWTLAVALAALAALLVGGMLLADADFGTSLRARSCDASVVPGLLLLAVGAALATGALQLSRLQHPAAVLDWEWRGVAYALPIPLVVALAALPGIMGCALAQDIADVGLVGDALVGAAGITVAGAAATLCGAALGSALHVTWQAPSGAAVEVPPGIVELAIQEAEALETDAASQRFHGVDSE